MVGVTLNFAAQHKKHGFLNEFYDDEGWWALAWLDVYELHGSARYLEMAESTFADMSSSFFPLPYVWRSPQKARLAQLSGLGGE